jgi:hypothetical protein
MMRLSISFSLILIGLLYACARDIDQQANLSGAWHFQVDSLDRGITEEWFNQKLPEIVMLPGSMAENGKGEDITINTRWTGNIIDQSWFTEDRYAKYRQQGNVKIPFWLQPEKHYIGAAWYQKEIDVPDNWEGRYIELILERPHWETQVWVDGHKVGMKNTLGIAHIYNLTNYIKPGKHKLTIRVDNSIKEINPGVNAHSISDHTQSNWNGIAGDILLSTKPQVFIENVKIYPDIHNKEILVKIKFRNISNDTTDGKLSMKIQQKEDQSDDKLESLSREIEIVDNMVQELVYPMGNSPKLWDEFHPNLYTMNITLEFNSGVDRKTIDFGMREFKTEGTRFTINGRPTFIRGTLECAIFPKTGYPSTDVDEWRRIFNVCKAHGLNNMRFHSWCPPEAAFQAADQTGVYLQVECSSWANQGSSIGDGKPIDDWVYKEAESILEAYGNHPSFCMMAYGNEPAGNNQREFLSEFVHHFRSQDPRRVYTGAAGWPYIEGVDYFNAPEARIQGWGQELNSIINKEPPQTLFDYSEIIRKIPLPYVSHEIGQWCVYPNFREINKYTGVLKAKNFEIFQETLKENHMGHLADSFLLASGKLQALCYKADIEAALRTKDFAGFQLLDLHDFPGQGTALVGVLDPFWEEKGYISPEEYNRFCNHTVPLVRLPKRIFYDNEIIEAAVEAAHFGTDELKDIITSWKLTAINQEIVAEGTFKKRDIPIGNGIKLGNISIVPETSDRARKLILTVEVSDFSNSWDIWIFPSERGIIEDENQIKIVQKLDKKTIKYLENGGKVLLTPVKGSLKDEYGGEIGIGFSSIFWNTAWTRKQKPHTLGILCDPGHPALSEFPTEYHSNWQWWDAMSHSNAIILDSFSPDLRPIVRVIDDWVTNRRLALIYEAKVEKGKLIVSGIDLLSNQENRPGAKQLLFSLKKYMSSDSFSPGVSIESKIIQAMYK